MEAIFTYLKNNPNAVKLLFSVAFLMIHLLILKVLTSVLFRTIKDNAVYYTTRKRFLYLLSLFYIFMLIVIWSGSRLDLTTYVGFISAGIAIALREIFTNIAAWLIIVTQKSFEVGDRIRFLDTCGDVIDIRLFHFIIMEVSSKAEGEQSTGRVVHVPNNCIFLHPMSNANKGFEYIWHEIEVKMPMYVSPDAATEVLKGILDKYALHQSVEAKEKVALASKRYQIQYNNLTPIVYLKVKEGAFYFYMRYLCEPRQARVTEDIIWRDLIAIAAENDAIELI
ncbi:mechanosensitive ion channel domain-containing protein [Fusibacter sp. JL298sf-3]